MGGFSGCAGFLIAAGRIFGISGISVSTEIYFRVVFAKNFPSCVPRGLTSRWTRLRERIERKLTHLARQSEFGPPVVCVVFKASNELPLKVSDSDS